MIGRVVGTYKILEPLGEGGVGMVYKGVDTMLDREVAIKVMRPELASQTSVVERFRSEAITLAKLNHPNIATLYSLFRDGEDLFMVLEFVEGETLEDILQRRGAIPSEEAMPYFCQALEGINYAHDLGIVHRDIKPSNMMVDSQGKLKVLDFGIARLLGTARMTRVGNIIGTLEYMSPEQVRGEETDARSDIYGLGMMLYEVLTGRLPFESDNEFVLMKAHTEEIPALPRSLNPTIPVEIELAIMKAIAKNPVDRFQDGGEFLETIFAMNLPTVSSSIGTRSMYQNPPHEAKSVESRDFPIDLSETAEVPIENSETEERENSRTIASQYSATSKGEIKETRLGGAVDNQVPPQVLKETRLGAPKASVTDSSLVKETRLGKSHTDIAPALLKETPNTSPIDNLLSKLNWIHFAGVGVFAIGFLSVLGLAVVVPFMFGSGKILEKRETVESVNSNTREVEPTLKREPTAEPTPYELPAEEEQTPSPSPVERIERPVTKPTPTPRATRTKRPTPRPTRKKRATPRPTRKKRTAPKRPRSTRGLEDELTDN